MNTEFNFDKQIHRRDTDSVKWSLFPEDVLPLWVADMDFPSPPEVVQALKERALHPFFGYGCDDDELREEICDWVDDRHGWKIQPDWLLLVPGVVTGMNWAIQSVLEAGKKIGMQTPVYPPFLKFAGNASAEAEHMPLTETREGYQVDFDRFEESLEDIGVFALCNPHNPVGKVFSRSELEQMADICMRKGVVICSDEIHCDLVYSPNTHIPIASMDQEIATKTITLMAPSKTFNIPGLEFSYAIVPDPELRQKMDRGRRGMIGHPGILAYPAAKAAYRYGGVWLDELLIYLEANRDFLFDYLRENMPGIKFHPPEGTYLAWLDCRDLALEKDPCAFFLDEARVALNNGRDFGMEGEGFVRLNFGTPRTNLKKALDRMKKALGDR